MLNPQTRASHTFPTMRYNVTLAVWTFSTKTGGGQDDSFFRPRQAKMIWELVSNQVSAWSAIWPRACHSVEACDVQRVISQHDASGWLDVNEIPSSFFLSLSLAVSSPAHACVLMWNESFMPVVHEASQPTHILTLPGSHEASVSIPRAYIHIYWIIITKSVRRSTKPPVPPPLGFSQVLVYFLPSPSVSLSVSQPSSVSLWEANLSAFPMMCLGNLFPGQPGYQILSQRLLAGASFCLHFSYLCEDVGCSKQTRMGAKKKINK